MGDRGRYGDRLAGDRRPARHDEAVLGWAEDELVNIKDILLSEFDEALDLPKFPSGAIDIDQHDARRPVALPRLKRQPKEGLKLLEDSRVGVLSC